MSADEYVPSYIAVKAPYIRARGAVDMDAWRAGSAEFDRFLARVRRDAAREALAQAEHRIARLEAQTSIRGRAVVMYRNRAREAEARIKAVQDTLLASDDGTEYDHNGHQPFEGEPECPGCWVRGIRRALDN